MRDDQKSVNFGDYVQSLVWANRQRPESISLATSLRRWARGTAYEHIVLSAGGFSAGFIGGYVEGGRGVMHDWSGGN